MELKKNPAADLEKQRNTFMLAGLAASLLIIYVMINWKTTEVTIADLGMVQVDIEDELIPITEQNTPPPPPPPPQVQEIIQIVEDDKEIKDEKKIQDSEADQKTEIQVVEQQAEEIVEEEIFTIVENMPTLPGCEKEKDEQGKQTCTQKKIFEHLGKVMKYPQMAKEAGIQGQVFVSFIIDKNGKVANVEVLRGVAGGKALDDEAVRMVKTLPDFTPGKQRGKNVQVRYSIPIKFSLK